MNKIIPNKLKLDIKPGKKYGVEIADGPLAALESRAVVLVDEKGFVTYTQQVPEIVDEPDYDEVLNALK